MKIAWKKIAVAGVLGFAGGRAVAKLREHPDAVLPILQVSVASGVLGAVVGWGVSAHRKVPTHVFSLSLATNFAVVSGAFLGIRQVIQNSLTERSSNSPSPQPFTTHWSSSSTQYISSSTSGGITGALIAIISRHGLRSILLTLLGGMGMGFCAQAGYNGLMIWRRKKAIELYCQDLGEGKRSRFENWTFDNFEARFLGFWHQKSEAVEVETEILALETAVAAERQKIAQLDKLLREKGDPLAELSELENTGTSSSDELGAGATVSL